MTTRSAGSGGCSRMSPPCPRPRRVNTPRPALTMTRSARSVRCMQRCSKSGSSQRSAAAKWRGCGGETSTLRPAGGPSLARSPRTVNRIACHSSTTRARSSTRSARTGEMVLSTSLADAATRLFSTGRRRPLPSWHAHSRSTFVVTTSGARRRHGWRQLACRGITSRES